MTYRIGNPDVDYWWGATHARAWATFEAPTDQAAWEQGQALVGATIFLLALDRMIPMPPARLLSGVAMNPILESQVWARVAVGFHGAPWTEGPPPSAQG